MQLSFPFQAGTGLDTGMINDVVVTPSPPAAKGMDATLVALNATIATTAGAPTFTELRAATATALAEFTARGNCPGIVSCSAGALVSAPAQEVAYNLIKPPQGKINGMLSAFAPPT